MPTFSRFLHTGYYIDDFQASYFVIDRFEDPFALRRKTDFLEFFMCGCGRSRSCRRSRLGRRMSWCARGRGIIGGVQGAEGAVEVDIRPQSYRRKASSKRKPRPTIVETIAQILRNLQSLEQSRIIIQGCGAMEILSVSVERFKRIPKIDLDLKNIMLVIGGNNSGKSSLLQGIHFSITTIQSTKMLGTTTLAPDQLIFKPTNDPILLYNGAKITQKAGPRFSFTYLAEGSTEAKKFQMEIKRGKNANISVGAPTRDPFLLRAADRTRPISIFVPGLAGVALREELRTDAIINTGIAQGDSNLYLRNVLLRIVRDANKIDSFHSIINGIFPGLTLSTDYDGSRDHYIDMKVSLDGRTLPLEMLGTGCLQAIQLVAYTTMYNPTLLLLDEPDSHLHPSNQRLLAETLIQISQATSTKIILSTHSRHLFDSLASNEHCEVVWLKNGTKYPVDNVSDISILLDLGALDSFERLTSSRTKAVVLTEDSKNNKFRLLLDANVFKDGEYYIQPLHGVDNLASAYPIADFFNKLGPSTHVLIHRDGDALLNDEKNWIIEKAASKLPPRSTLFITPLTDIEHQFCKTEHIANVFGISEEEAEAIVQGAIAKISARLTALFTNKRQNAKDRLLRKKEDAPSAHDLLTDSLPFEYAKGKALYGQIIQDLNAASYNGNRLALTKSAALHIPVLSNFAREVWGPNHESDPPPTQISAGIIVAA